MGPGCRLLLFKGDIDSAININIEDMDIDFEADVDLDRRFGCLKEGLQSQFRYS